jgi:hypothetical protein
MDGGEATDEGGAILLLELGERGAVEQAGEHLGWEKEGGKGNEKRCKEVPRKGKDRRGRGEGEERGRRWEGGRDSPGQGKLEPHFPVSLVSSPSSLGAVASGLPE